MSAAEALGLPPGVRFDPTGDELVEFYLLPRALGRPPAVPGIIIEDDDTATATASAQHPWKLLTRHRRTDDSEAYFFERVTSSGDTKGGGARQDRSCGSRWTWVGQKRAPDEALPQRGDGERVSCSWGKYSLNLQEGRRKGGSTGWVMHEYTVSSPQCPLLPVKLCHVSFTGHGQKRQRVPDDDGEGQGQELEPQAATEPQHKRAATGSSMVPTATAMPNQELSLARAQDQEQQFPNYDYNSSSTGHFWSSDAGFSQESSIIQDPPYPDAPEQQLTQNQECPASQSQAYHQERFIFTNPVGSSSDAHCAALSAPDLGSSEEPQVWDPLIEAEQFSLAQLLGAISSPLCPPAAPAACHEQQQIHSFAQAPMPDLPLSTNQESCTTTEQSHGNMDHQFDDFFRGWGELDSFCDTSGIQDDDMAAAPTLPSVSCRGGSSWDRQFFYQQPAL